MKSLPAFATLLLFVCQPSALALPQFLQRFAADPFSRPELRDKCLVCHVNPAGSGPRNDFGQAFGRNQFRVTPDLRTSWPDRFLQILTASSPAAPVKATWNAASDDQVSIEVNGQAYVLDRARGLVHKAEAAPVAAISVADQPIPESSTLPLLRRIPTFDYYLINLPTTRERIPGSLHLRFSHRFSEPAFEGTARLARLFGFDSFSISSFGVEAGVWKRVGFVTYRTPYSRLAGGPTIELGPSINLVEQGGRAPVSAAFRLTVEGQHNFTERFTTNLVPIVSRAFSDVAEIFVAPIFSLGVPRRTLTGDFAFTPGERRDHLVAIGIGGSFRIRPRTAVVVEWSPRVAGFRGFATRNSYAFAVQRTTARHVFGLTLSNNQSTTTLRSLTDGAEDLRIGFNLYRRIW